MNQDNKRHFSAGEIAERLFPGATIDLAEKSTKPTIMDDAAFATAAAAFTPEIPQKLIQAACGDTLPTQDEILEIINNDFSQNLFDAIGDTEIIEKFKAGVLKLIEDCVKERLIKKSELKEAREKERRENVKAITNYSREQLKKFAMGEEVLLDPKKIVKALIAEGKPVDDFNPFEDTVYWKRPDGDDQ